MASVTAVPATVQPHPYRPELALLRVFLAGHSYSEHCRERIVRHAAEEGTLEGCIELEAEDYEGAEAVFVDGHEPVSRCSNAWDDPGIYTDLDTLLEAGRPRLPVEDLVPPELDPDPELPPIAGGAPDGPTAADWAEYREWSERLDRLEGLPRDRPEPPVYGYE